MLLEGAIVGCHCSVLWWGEGSDGQLWGSGRGAIGGCHCSVLWSGASVTTKFGGVDVPLQGRGTLHSNGAQKNVQKNCLEFLETLLCSLYIDTTKIVFCYLGSTLV